MVHSKSPAWTRLAFPLLTASCALAGCDSAAAPGRAEPRLPANLEDAAPAVAERIHAARTKLQERPRDATRWSLLGMVYEANGLPDLALDCYDEAVELRDDEPRYWYRRATVLERLGDVDEAIESLRRSIRLREHAPAHWKLGTWLLGRSDFDAALEAFRAARQADPSFPGGWVGSARVHLERDENDEAIEVLDHVVALAPRDAYVHQLLGRAHNQAGRLPEAEMHFVAAGSERASWPDQWDEEVWSHSVMSPVALGKKLIESGQPERAVPLLEKGREQSPDDVGLLRTLAGAYQSAGRLDDALEVLSQSLKIEPRHTATYMNLVFLYEARGDTAAALQNLDAALALQPTWGRGYEIKGRLLFTHKDYGAALQAFREALQYDARNPKLRLWIGTIELELRDWSGAARTFEAALRADASSVDTVLGLAQARIELNQFDEAERVLDGAQPGIDPSRLEATRRLLHARRSSRAAGEDADESGG